LNRQSIIIVLVIVLAIGATTGVFALSRQGAPSQRPLPPGCVKPADGFLIVASDTGYNDSIGHGAPASNWPIIDVEKGQNVTIVVCNTDLQAHGFQITHYYDATDGHSEVTLSPGQVITVNFVANQEGKFDIYCEIFCSIHIYMQSGLLNVTSSA
jgi:FtsP/CotA-like multicopper oxidase with cupredoxin domain